MAPRPESAPLTRDIVADPAGPVQPQLPPAAPSGLLSAVTVSATRCLSQALILFLGVLSAAYFGAGMAKDCYVIAQAIPSILGAILVGGLYNLLVVGLAETGPRLGVNGQLRLIRQTLAWLGCVLIPMILLAIAFPRLWIALIAPGFDPDRLDLSARLLPWTMFAMAGTVLFAVFRALYNTHHRFAVPGFVNLLVGATSLATLVLLVGRAGIFALALGPVLGTLLAVAVLGAAAPRLLKDTQGFVPRTDEAAADRGSIRWRDFVPMTVGANFGQVNLLVDNSFASFLPAGTITRFGFASVIIASAELLTIFSLAEVAFPRFSAAAHRGAEALAEELRLYLRFMLLITAPIGSGCLAFGAPLARLLFERGEFDPESTAAVGRILACFSPEVLFMGYFAVFWRFLLAKRRMSAIVWTSLGAMALNGVLNALLIKPFGISGIALSTSGVTMVFALVLGYLVHREGMTILAPGESMFILRVLAGAAFMGLVVFAGSSWFERTFDMQTESARLAEVGGGLALGGLVYALSLLLLGIREVPDALGRLARTMAAWTRG